MTRGALFRYASLTALAAIVAGFVLSATDVSQDAARSWGGDPPPDAASSRTAGTPPATVFEPAAPQTGDIGPARRDAAARSRPRRRAVSPAARAEETAASAEALAAGGAPSTSRIDDSSLRTPTRSQFARHADAPIAPRVDTRFSEARIAIRLRDETGAPVSQARVRVSGQGPGGDLHVTTDAAGEAVASVGATGRWTVRVEDVPAAWLPTGGPRADLPLVVAAILDEAEPAVVLDWTLTRAATVLLRPSAAVPVGARAHISVFRRAEDGRLLHLRGLAADAAADGFRVERLPPGDLEIRVDVPGFGVGAARVTAVPATTSTGHLPLRGDGTVLVVTTDAAALPAGHYSLGQLVRGAEPPVQRTQWIPSTGAPRRDVRFEGLAAGEYTLGLPATSEGGPRVAVALHLRQGENVLRPTTPTVGATRMVRVVPDARGTADAVSVLDPATCDAQGATWGVCLLADGVARPAPTGAVRWIIARERDPLRDGTVRTERTVHVPEGDGVLTFDVTGEPVSSATRR